MRSLARERGCLLCHSLKSEKTQQIPPIGPSFTDIAQRYKRHKDALDRLTHTVLQGTTSDAKRHWAGKVSATAMPPNEWKSMRPRSDNCCSGSCNWRNSI